MDADRQLHSNHHGEGGHWTAEGQSCRGEREIWVEKERERRERGNGQNEIERKGRGMEQIWRKYRARTGRDGKIELER